MTNVLLDIIWFPFHHPAWFLFGLLLIGGLILYTFFAGAFTRLLDVLKNLSGALKSLIEWFGTPSGQMFGIVLVLALVFMAGYDLRGDREDLKAQLVQAKNDQANLTRQRDQALKDLQIERASAASQAAQIQDLNEFSDKLKGENDDFKAYIATLGTKCTWTAADIERLQPSPRSRPRQHR